MIIQTILEYIDTTCIHNITKQTVPNWNKSISKKSAYRDIYSGFDLIFVYFLAL